MKRKYICIRCGYETEYKSAMHNHFYRRKKPCPLFKNNIDLTEDIKDHILQNFVYILPINRHDDTKQLNTTINNYHTVNNFIANMDVLDKMTKYLEYKRIKLLDFDKKVETKYMSNVRRLDNNLYKFGFQLSSDDFLEIINEVSSLCDGESYENFNIMYDNKVNKLRVYELGTWEEMLLNSGIRKIVQIIQDNYLDSYEQYLIKILNHTDTTHRKRQQCKEHLQEYYSFIGAFEVPAYVQNMHADNIREDIIDTYWKLYTTTRDNLKRCDINKTKKDVVDILKRNTVRNIEEMNKKIINLFKIDESFKQDMMKHS